MTRIALIACSKSKADTKCPARELYRGALFRKARQLVEHDVRCGAVDAWFILSARYGLVEPLQDLSPYDDTLTTYTTGQRMSWARRVVTQLEARFIVDGWERPTLVWYAGMTYREHIQAMLPGYANETPLAGLGIGQQLGYLTQQLQAVPS